MSEILDETAVGLLLDESLPELKELAHRAEVSCGFQCPSCGGQNVEDNGESASSTTLSIYCHDCDMTFDPNMEF